MGKMISMDQGLVRQALGMRAKVNKLLGNQKSCSDRLHSDIEDHDPHSEVEWLVLM